MDLLGYILASIAAVLAVVAAMPGGLALITAGFALVRDSRLAQWCVVAIGILLAIAAMRRDGEKKGKAEVMVKVTGGWLAPAGAETTEAGKTACRTRTSANNRRDQAGRWRVIGRNLRQDQPAEMRGTHSQVGRVTGPGGDGPIAQTRL